MSDAETLREEYSNQLCHCSFCGKAQGDVERMVAGPAVYICNECVVLCDRVIAGSADKPKDAHWRQITWLQGVDTDLLKTRLRGIEKLRDDIGLQQQMTIDVLRSRKTSWAEIGRILGITRQAAWQRFGAADSVAE